jgi:hypothetical protein
VLSPFPGSGTERETVAFWRKRDTLPLRESAISPVAGAT